MPCTYALKKSGDCLLAEIEGTAASAEELFEFDQAILEEAKKLGIRKMLRDVRRVDFDRLFYDDVISLMEKRLELTNRNDRLVVAVVVSNERLGKMFETVARTRSFNLRSFLNYDEALSWLKDR